MQETRATLTSCVFET